MLKRLYLRLKGFIGRVTEVTGVVLALFAAYEMIIANRIVPYVVGGVALCEIEGRPDLMLAKDFFAFIEDNADGVVYLDMFAMPLGAPGMCADGHEPRAYTGEEGFRAEGPARSYEDGFSGATPELVIRFSDFNTPQTARLTGQSGEEPIFGVTGLVYIEAGEIDAGYQSFTLSAAPYDAGMLKKRACTADYLSADGAMNKARAYLFSCLAS